MSQAQNNDRPEPAQTSATKSAEVSDVSHRKDLTPEAQRALAEAEERRAKQGAKEKAETELQGRDGPEPTRYGDWEKDGIISDF